MAPSRGKSAKSKPKAKISELPEKASNLSIPSSSKDQTRPAFPVPDNLLQALLTTFRHAFPAMLESNLQDHTQEIKKHLFNRDFENAFSRPELLETYAIRWSPSRALGYVGVFQDIFKLTQGRTFSLRENAEPPNGTERAWGIIDGVPPTSVLCLGGGAGAELVALAGFLNSQDSIHKLTIETVDLASWSEPLNMLHRTMTMAPPLSLYAAASVRAKNSALVEPECFRHSFNQLDILASGSSAKLRELVRKSDVVTIMYTLNELYSCSLQRTQQLLQLMTEEARSGMILVVVDSPGSYTEVKIGKEGKNNTYPMQFLLDYGLGLTSATNGEKRAEPERPAESWEKVVEDRARWFRLPKGLKYPIELENMRFQIHAYRKL